MFSHHSVLFSFSLSFFTPLNCGKNAEKNKTICTTEDQIRGCPIYIDIFKIFDDYLFTPYYIYVYVYLQCVSVVGNKTFFYSHTQQQQKCETHSCSESVNDSQFKCMCVCVCIYICVWENLKLLLLIWFTHFGSMCSFFLSSDRKFYAWVFFFWFTNDWMDE